MNEREDIHWNAFRYVMADLDEAETERFERQLEDDQAAREAVAEAVRLKQSVAVVESECNPRTHRSVLLLTGDRWRAGATWIAMGAAICVAIAVAMIRLPPPEPTLTQSTRRRSVTLGQIAIVWSETHDAMNNPLWPPEQLEFSTNDARVAEADLHLPDIELTASDDSESWIQQAVVGLVEQTTDGKDDTIEEL